MYRSTRSIPISLLLQLLLLLLVLLLVLPASTTDLEHGRVVERLSEAPPIERVRASHQANDAPHSLKRREEMTDKRLKLTIDLPYKVLFPSLSIDRSFACWRCCCWRTLASLVDGFTDGGVLGSRYVVRPRVTVVVEDVDSYGWLIEWRCCSLLDRWRRQRSMLRDDACNGGTAPYVATYCRSHTSRIVDTGTGLIVDEYCID